MSTDSPTITIERCEGGFAIRAGETVLTRLLRNGSKSESDCLLAPPELLAEWLVANWWRLRWETKPAGGMVVPNWDMAHDMRAIGQGYAWPRVQIWGAGEEITFLAEPDPVGVVGPVRFLADVCLPVSGSEYERETDDFLDSIRGANDRDLGELRNERQNPELAAWRRLEAMLGFDAGDAPESLMNELAQLAEQYGEAGIEEAAAASPGDDAAAELKRSLGLMQAGLAVKCDFGEASKGKIELSPASGPMWKLAEPMAARLRAEIGDGPLVGKAFHDLLGLPTDALDRVARDSAYGLRFADGSRNLVLARSGTRVGRRFEFARALGDALHPWATDGPIAGSRGVLAPIGRAKTARQQFQRAFAAALLCPIKELKETLGPLPADNDAVESAAEYYEVSPRVVQSSLVNHGLISRSQFENMVAVG